jgi:hypothetical protein
MSYLEATTNPRIKVEEKVMAKYKILNLYLRYQFHSIHIHHNGTSVSLIPTVNLDLFQQQLGLEHTHSDSTDTEPYNKLI